MEQTESMEMRFKALNDDTFAEMRVENGQVFRYVYDRSGRLLDVLEEVASNIRPDAEWLTK